MGVWVLMIAMGQGGVTVIDNIATAAECQRVETEIRRVSAHLQPKTLCLEVAKRTGR